MKKIRIRVLRHSAFYSPLLAAITGGFLKKEGLDPDYSIATPEKTIPAGIADGRVHVAQSAVSTSWMLLEKSQTPNYVHFAQINERDGFFITGRKTESVFDWGNLVGKRILADHFFQPLAMLKYALHKHGIAFSDLDAIDAGDVDAMDRAFREGGADYVHQQGPAPQQLEADGVGHIVASVGESIGPVAFSSLCASRQWLQTDMAAAFMRAYRKARHYVINAPASEVAQMEADFFPNIDVNVLTQTIATYQQLGCWPANPCIKRETYERALEIFEFSGLITRHHVYEDVVIAPPED